MEEPIKPGDATTVELTDGYESLKMRGKADTSARARTRTIRHKNQDNFLIFAPLCYFSQFSQQYTFKMSNRFLDLQVDKNLHV
jgi:hypothetical protein